MMSIWSNYSFWYDPEINNFDLASKKIPAKDDEEVDTDAQEEGDDP